jgi:hypothetical protein
VCADFIFNPFATACVLVSSLIFVWLSRYLRQGIARSSKTTADEIKALRGVLSMLDDIEAVFHQKAVNV